ncbi:MAG: metallophosphoesterase [candidate division NC10 bacterium]|nr:metallophosphoesterase [candidate division NC10 bacterium]MBI2113466.1 metallophosphoesterase [candidate division NC10 bacterium]MBI2163106.1 metallophosphoesterase [candidate division NC10 bacterium]MBI2454889.1 metallophosphoesterase [candidate division NC10 bacterium]
MLFGTHILLFRLIVFGILALAQGYLFVRIRQVIRGSRRPAQFTFRVTCLVGATMGLLFVLNAFLVFRHFPWVDPPMVAQVGLLYPAAVWNFGSVFSALFLFLTRAAGELGRRLGWTRRLATAPAPVPVDPGRRRFLRAGVGGLATAPLLLSGYGAAYASKAYDVQEITLPFGRSLRVAHLTDIHAGLYMTREEMRRYADLVTALQPDLFVLTGDFISNSMSFLPGCAQEMARVRARYGTFATLGNHEHWFGTLREIQGVFQRHGISLLNNAHRVLRTEQGPVAVAGIDDLRTGSPDLEATLRGLDRSIPTLLLSHRPEIFPQAAGHGIPLTLAGHWHGGQIKLSVLGVDVSLAHLLSPYPEGLYRINASHLYVSRGIGTTGTPIRLNAPPEVTLFRLA